VGIKKLVMYITILNFELGKTFIHVVEDNVDVEEFVSENYGLDSTQYMSTETLNLEINN